MLTFHAAPLNNFNNSHVYSVTSQLTNILINEEATMPLSAYVCTRIRNACHMIYCIVSF